MQNGNVKELKHEHITGSAYEHQAYPKNTGVEIGRDNRDNPIYKIVNSKEEEEAFLLSQKAAEPVEAKAEPEPEKENGKKQKASWGTKK